MDSTIPGSETTQRSPYSLTNPMVIDGVSYIPSRALVPGMHKIALKANEVFAIFDDTGSSPRLFSQELGVFWRDTRYLDVWELIINGEALSPLDYSIDHDARSCTFTMTNRDMVAVDDGGRIARDLFAIRRVITLTGEHLCEDIEITNYAPRPHTLRLERRAASRFSDIFEVRGMQRDRRGDILRPVVSNDKHAVTLAYRGLNAVTYTTRIWSTQPLSNLRLEPDGVLIEHLVSMCASSTSRCQYVVDFGQTAAADKRSLATADADREASAVPKDVAVSLQLPVITTSCSLLNKALATAGADILSLMTQRGNQAYPDAGIPWYCAPFGRDGIITAYQLLPWCSAIAGGVIDYCLQRLGTTVDPFTDAEPGKVFHEERFGEMAQQREVPFVPYYGSVDATPLVLILLGEYAAWTGKLAAVRSWWEQARLALAWVRANIAASASGFLTYQASRATGLRNQGWKDSHDAITHMDGAIAEPPIALCEVQGYAYRALIAMAKLARCLQIDGAEATLWEAEAAALRERFHQQFWSPQRRMVVLALDGRNQPCCVQSSNQGQVLWSGLVNDSEAAKLAASLLGPALFSGHGIRTLAATETAYNPLSYHNGSVWPHDNSLIAEGLRHYDRRSELVALASAQLRVAQRARDNRLPELFCGFPRSKDSEPVPYDVACKPQAWAAGAVFLLLKALLGMQMRPHSGELIFKSPLLPEQLDYIEVRNLPIHDGMIDFIARRGSLNCTIEVMRKSDEHIRVIAVT